MSEICFDKPAGWDWNQALPIGCGTLGAMIYGGFDSEHCQMNEDSIWFGGPQNRVNPDAKKNLSKVRQLIFDGKISEAERLLKMAFSGAPQSERSYQTAGELYLDFNGSVTKPVGFSRVLDLKNGIHTVTVTDEATGITYTREAFASVKYNCIVIHISADRPQKIKASAVINREGFCDYSQREAGMTWYGGNQGKGGVDYVCALAMTAENGSVENIGEFLVTDAADSVTVYWTARTTFRSENPLSYAKECLENAKAVPYEAMKAEHVEAYRKQFGTVTLELGTENPENERMKRYFDFGRYLLISSSQPNSLPANLQGIWNKDMTPAWGSKYTININAQMNYWPAETLGLSECHLPLFDLLCRLAENGEKVAKDMYGCRGFVAHHNTDMWADCAPQDMYTPATIWPMGGAWLCTHVWQHFEYTGDFDFLKKMYPIVKKSVLFFFDYLVEKDGAYVTCPTTSPENTYLLPNGEHGCVCYGATMDSQILRDLLTGFLKEAELVGEEDAAFLDRAREILSKLPKTQIGTSGRIMEWTQEYEETEPGHRHISHLYGLHPGKEIQMRRTADLAAAARKTLETRLASGGGHTGWSRAWIMNFYARLWDGDACYDNFVQLLNKSTLPNLFDNHPPFQIDGNFGAIAAVGEMLLQSVEDEVYLLPALPKQWPSGKITGIRAAGGAKYSMEWENNELVSLKVEATRDYCATLFYKGKTLLLNMKSGESKLIKEF